MLAAGAEDEAAAAAEPAADGIESAREGHADEAAAAAEEDGLSSLIASSLKGSMIDERLALELLPLLATFFSAVLTFGAELLLPDDCFATAFDFGLLRLLLL